MKCPICNEEVATTEQAERWGPEFAHSRCVVAYNHGKADAAPEAPAHPSVPAPWREAVKALREALESAAGMLEVECLELSDTYKEIRAAIALADSLEGGE